MKINVSSAGKEPDLDNAFDKLLATFESDYQISLHFGDQRRMLVTVKEGSLEQVNEAVHPAARSHSYLSLRATYTVGSMAGLGFSMAVVGLSMGIFVGFILWKGRLGLQRNKSFQNTGTTYAKICHKK